MKEQESKEGIVLDETYKCALKHDCQLIMGGTI